MAVDNRIQTGRDARYGGLTYAQWKAQGGNSGGGGGGGGTPNFNFPTNIYPKSEQYSGLPTTYRDQINEALIPQLLGQVKDYPKYIDETTNNALSSYRTQLESAMKESTQGTMGNLAKRGVLGSTVASNALAEQNRKLYGDFANQGYQTAMQAAAAKAQAPEMLSNILTNLGRYSSGSSEDKTAMYSIMASMLRNMV